MLSKIVLIAKNKVVREVVGGVGDFVYIWKSTFNGLDRTDSDLKIREKRRERWRWATTHRVFINHCSQFVFGGGLGGGGGELTVRMRLYASCSVEFSIELK